MIEHCASRTKTQQSDHDIPLIKRQRDGVIASVEQAKELYASQRIHKATLGNIRNNLHHENDVEKEEEKIENKFWLRREFY